MSLTILETVKEFLIRLVKDEDFRTQLISDKVEDIRKVMADSGYNFSQDEFETAAIEILELKELGHFEELSEEELVGAVGGVSSQNWWDDWSKRKRIKPIEIQPHYGVVIEQPDDKPKPDPVWKPLPGVEFQPVDAPEAIAHYGVIAPTELI